MKSLLSILITVWYISASAQTITYGSVDLTDPEDPDWKSTYPFFLSSNKPGAAELINMALQMSDFRKTATKKNPNALKRTGDSPYVWNFKVTRPSDKIIEVTTIKTTLAFGMQSGPYETIYVYHFDAETGDRVYPSTFFSPGGFMSSQNIAMDGLVKVMRKNKQDLQKEHPDMPASEMFVATYDDDCQQQIAEEWDNETVRLNLANDSITFIVNDCPNYIPRRNHVTYTSRIAVKTLSSRLSDDWKYYFENGPKPIVNEYEHVWRGTLGTNIPVTIMLRRAPDSMYHYGWEVYDNYGVAIKVEGTFDEDEAWLLIDELDGDKVLGTYKLRFNNQNLEGSWKKADGSKTLPFKARRPQ